MAIECFLKRQMGALRPFDALGEEAINALRNGDVVKVVITRPRNVTFHNKFFALLSVLFPHQDYYPTLTKFRKAVQIALGYCEETVLPSGKIMVEADSIAFHKMDEAEFDQLMAKFFALAETRILPGVSKEDVQREWEEVMKGYQNT